MGRWPTYTSLARGPVGSDEVARAFQDSLVERLLAVLWETYDALSGEEYDLVADWNADIRDLERHLTEEFELELSERVRVLDGGYLPVRVQHERKERESQKGNRGQPPSIDIAFVWEHEKRITWPVEVKALRSDVDRADGPRAYVGEGVQRFLDRTYAPFVRSGAMLGFLRSGSPTTLAVHIGARLGVPLQRYGGQPERDHWTSDHVRSRAGGDGTEPFLCHHLILKLDG